MLSVSDLRVSISSIQFSLFFDSNLTLCPKCGHILETSALTEVTLSSLVLLLGVGSLVYYKWMSEKNKKKRRLPFGFAKSINDQNMINQEMSDESVNIYDNSGSNIIRHGLLSSTPFLRSSISLDFNKSMTSSESSDLLMNLSELTDDNESWLKKTSFDTIGNKTVAKLDELLEQIRDIKQSVCEIDEQIFDVKEPNVKFDPKMFSLGPDMISSLTTESDINEVFPNINTEPQTPTLEWDSMDLNTTDGHKYELKNENLLNSEITPNLSLNEISGTKSINNSNSFESPEDLTSPSNSTSGEFSLSSPSEPTKPRDNNSEAIHRIISDAKKLGLLKELIDILVINSKRDSAYFED